VTGLIRMRLILPDAEGEGRVSASQAEVGPLVGSRHRVVAGGDARHERLVFVCRRSRDVPGRSGEGIGAGSELVAAVAPKRARITAMHCGAAFLHR
jgi:hypothetical protein